jgi:hypothetical protein
LPKNAWLPLTFRHPIAWLGYWQGFSNQLEIIYLDMDIQYLAAIFAMVGLVRLQFQ